MKIKTKLFLGFLILVCTLAIVYFVFYNNKNSSTTKKIIKSINYNNIKSIKCLIGEGIFNGIKTPESLCDVTDAKINISNNFKNNQYFKSTWGGSNTRLLIIENYDGSIIKISCSFDSFNVYDFYDGVEFYNENIRLFITGLNFDKNSRIFDRGSMEKFLLPRVENFEPEALIELINIQSSMVQVLLPKTLQAIVSNSNDDQLHNLLYSLGKIYKMSDKSVIDNIAHLAKNKDINIAKKAAGILKS